ncbi:MAG: chemotaxis protein CheW [Steroidobacteraceae bacterium]
MEQGEVYCLLIPLAEGRLIVPRACVAEVIGMQMLTQMAGAPPWYLGLANWNARQIPVVSFEGTCGQAIPAITNRSRIVMLHAIGMRLNGGVFGVVAQGFPQLVRLSMDVVHPELAQPLPERAPIISRLRMLNETPLVPDLERLEQMVADETSATG